MTQAEEHEELVGDVATKVRNVILDSPFVAVRGADFRDREKHRTDFINEVTHAVLAVIAEKAKEWPTEEMGQAFYASGDADYDWHSLLAASPLIKPEDLK